MAIRFGNVTLRWYSDQNLVVYLTGKRSGFRNTKERYLKPPEEATGGKSNYGGSTRHSLSLDA